MEKIKSGKVTVKLNSKNRRDSLFWYLGDIVQRSHKKATSRGRSDQSQLAWARVFISAINTYGSLLKDAILEDLEERIERLERREQNTSWEEKMSR